MDVIYNATYNNLHATISIAAMNHKKHVLCEKPVAINTIELRDMIAASKQNNVFFMEAFWSRFNPAIGRVKDLVDNGEIGEIRYINADFAFYGLDRDPGSRLFNVDFGGGSLLDIGIYPIFLSYLLLGVPEEIVARSKFFRTGAEVQTSMIFDYKEAQAVLHSSFKNNTEMKAKICGEKGEIYIGPVWHKAQGFSISKDGIEEEISLPTLGAGYTHEIMEAHKCINRGALESELWSHQNSLDLLGMLDAIRGKMGIKFPFEK